MLDINTEKIEAELQELADYLPHKEGEPKKPRRSQCKVKVKLNKSQDIACSTRETDAGFSITFNPKRYRTPAKLEAQLDDLRQELVWGS